MKRVLLSIVFFLASIVGAQVESVASTEGLYVSGGMGAAVVTGLPENGTWIQDGMPSEKERMSLGYKAGLGYGWNHWYIEASYINLGSMHNAGSFVGDQDYSTSLKACISCSDVSTGWVHGTMHGGELSAGYRWNTEGLIQPRLHGGVFGGTHKVSFADNYPSVGHSREHSYQGMVLGVTGGAGLCVAWVCVDANYYQVVSHTGYPFARGIVMPTLSVNVPLTSW